jgi:hypothetical protein
MPSTHVAGHEVLLDEIDQHLLLDAAWTVRASGATFYIQRTIRTENQYEGYESLHRRIMRCSEGAVVDHINGNGLDNRRANLRVCSQAENLRNRKIHSNNSCGLKGVYWDDSNRGGSWRAQIRVNGKKINLGRFATSEAAHAAYCIAAGHYHGEFARVA